LATFIQGVGAVTHGASQASRYYIDCGLVDSSQPEQARVGAFEEEIVMRLRAFASAAAIVLSYAVASLAHAVSFQVMAGDTTGAPTFNRALEDFSGLSAVGTANPYTTYTFTVSVSGDYIFNTTAAFDSFVFLYQGSFNPADATSNGVIANDDLIYGNSFYASGFEVALTAGTTYIYVVTGFDLTDAGAYSTTIAGPTMTTAVPEVQTYLLMALGLAGLAVVRRRQLGQR
jgi:hypothetical protein